MHALYRLIMEQCENENNDAAKFIYKIRLLWKKYRCFTWVCQYVSLFAGGVFLYPDRDV